MTRRVKWLASLGLVATLAVGSATVLAPSASARAKHHVRVTTAPLTATAPVTTASFTFSVGVSGLGKSLGTINLSGSGEADLVNDAVSVSATLPAAVAKLIPGSSAGAETVNAVLSGGTAYVQIPSLATLVGEPWISLALPSSATAAIPGIFTTVGGALGDVNQIITFAQSHHAKVKSLASSVVDGTSVTGSQITARVKGLKLSATLWANSSGQLVQAKVNAAVGGGHHLGISAVVDLSGYGAPVTISAPNPADVRAVPLSVVTSVLGGLLHNVHLGH